MKKIHLKTNEDDRQNLMLYGIVSSELDYRLSWLLGNDFGLQFSRIEDHEYNVESNNSEYLIYYALDEIKQVRMYVISNKMSGGGYLAEKLKKIDFFLILRSDEPSEDTSQYISKLRKANYLSIVPLEINVLKELKGLLTLLE